MPYIDRSAPRYGLLFLGFALGFALGSLGCAEGPRDSNGLDEDLEVDVASAQAALQTPVCVTVRRGSSVTSMTPS